MHRSRRPFFVCFDRSESRSYIPSATKSRKTSILTQSKFSPSRCAISFAAVHSYSPRMKTSSFRSNWLKKTLKICPLKNHNRSLRANKTMTMRWTLIHFCRRTWRITRFFMYQVPKKLSYRTGCKLMMRPRSRMSFTQRSSLIRRRLNKMLRRCVNPPRGLGETYRYIGLARKWSLVQEKWRFRRRLNMTRTRTFYWCTWTKYWASSRSTTRWWRMKHVPVTS